MPSESKTDSKQTDSATTKQNQKAESATTATTIKQRPSFQGPCAFTPDQLTVNKYEPGHGIPPHVDTHSAFTYLIVSLSLGAETVMDFRKQEPQQQQEHIKQEQETASVASTGKNATAAVSELKQTTQQTLQAPDQKQQQQQQQQRIVSPRKQDTTDHLPVVLPRRSLLILNGASRYAWSHGIASRKMDNIQGRIVERQTRVSLTFRRLRRGGPCDCKFPALCDSKRTNTNASGPVNATAISSTTNANGRSSQPSTLPLSAGQSESEVSITLLASKSGAV